MLTAILIALASTAENIAPSVIDAYANSWQRLESKSDLYSVEMPCAKDDALKMSEHTQKFVPVDSSTVVDATCYTDRALFTAQTVAIKNPQNRFKAIWTVKNDPKLKRIALAGGQRAIDTRLSVGGNDVFARYYEMEDGGFVALSVERIALDDVTQDVARYFASFRRKGQF